MNVTAAYSNSFTLFRENFLLFFTLAFAGIVAVTVIESLLFGVEYAVYGAPVTVENDVAIPGLNAGMLLWGLMSQVLLSALSAVLHLAAWDVMRGAHPQPNAYLNRSAQMILPLFFLSIVVGIIVGFGVILLIIPGIYLFGMFAVLVPIIVIEGRGWEAMMRCVELSRGRRWQIAGSFVGLLVLLIAIVIVSAAIMGAIGDSIGAVLIVNTVISSLIFAFFAIFTTEIYGQLVNSEG